ncbi:MAG: DUF885 domain-containing protein [Armatimonadetes bacterium]|nr:DUF885 domain-containing protein [Armatimonadota bacterium]MCX7967004.1 DUF885 domain-containing protein [Armatimonadota bacterium]MDW8142735.1 DUF885 domain-containing protein [Armatimonadota bacterium]
MIAWSQLVDEILQTLWQDDPVFATACGIHNYDHKLASLAPEAVEHHISMLKGFISQLEQIDGSLSKEEDADRQALLAWMRGRLVDWEAIQWHKKEPALYLDHALYGAYLLVARDFAPLQQRMECLASRLKEFKRLVQEAKVNIAPEQVPPVYLETASETLEGAKAFLSTAVPQAAEMLGEDSLKRDVLKSVDDAGVALTEFEAWLRDSVSPKAQGSFAVGEDLFVQLLRMEHLLTETPDELETMGREILEQAKAELEKVAKSVDPNLTWFELVERLKEHHPPKERIVETYAEEVAKARQFIIDKGIVTIPEGEQLRVVETPQFERATTPYAAYMPPAPFDERTEGLFYVTPIDPKEPEEIQRDRLRGHCLFALPIVVIHEAYPGHHLQLTVAANLPSKVRKVFGNNLFVEGWALYCEEMMWEQGYWDDPRIRLFQLKDLIWRAVRVIVDVGLHCKGMSFNEAVKWLVSEAHLEHANALAEVRRYTASPTQPLSYLTGKMAILKLREEMQRREGAEFSLKRFHDKLLQSGGLPIRLVEQLLM